MTIEYTGRHTTITPKLKAQAEAALERINRVTNRCTKAHIILTEDKYRRLAEVTLQCRGDVLVGTSEATEMETALHDALARVEQQAVKSKERYTTVRGHAPKRAEIAVAENQSAA